jgi:hypothetical protein
MLSFDKIKVLTFAKGNFIESQNTLIKQLESIGISNIIIKTDNDLPVKFKSDFLNLLNQTKGYGYCIWKPYIIIDELNKLNDDEVLIYIDSTDFPEKLLFEIAISHFNKNDLLLVNRGYNHGEWTKRDCFILMNCDEPKYYNHVQLEAGLIGLKKTNFNLTLLNEWFEYSKNENILTFIPNNCGQPNLPNFKEHRYDQSILTNLSIKYNLQSVKFPTHVIKYNYNQPQIYG